MFLVPLLLVAGCCLTQGDAEVLTGTFKNSACSRFFFNGEEPKGLVPSRAARICQRFAQKYRFATMYDRKIHIPIYSAYIFEAPIGDDEIMRPPNEWYIEPQLVDRRMDKAMIPQTDANVTVTQLKKSQAVTEDYSLTTKKYDRGHLKPSLHYRDSEDQTSTFTLTNIVPQNKTLNRGTWNYYESSMKTQARNCAKTAKTYAIVGVVPGKHYIPSDNDTRVNIPSHIWAAACCQLNNNRMHSWAVIAENNGDVVHNISVGELERKIHRLTKIGVRLFHEKCPRQSSLPMV